MTAILLALVMLYLAVTLMGAMGLIGKAIYHAVKH